MHVVNLERFEQLCVCALNFTDATKRTSAVFANYDAHVEVTTNDGEGHKVNLDSNEPGAVAMICKLLRMELSMSSLVTLLKELLMTLSMSALSPFT